MTSDELADLLTLVERHLDAVADDDWSRPARHVEWTCWQTIDRTIDCVFSYALQVAARAESGFLGFSEMRADADAQPKDLICGLGAVGTMFLAVVRDAPAGTTASDGVLTFDLSDWCARAGYEIALHGYDALSGLGSAFAMSDELAASIIESPALWMFDRRLAQDAAGAWEALLLGSGRPPPA